MKFRGLRSVIVERDATGKPKRREIVIQTVFARGIATDARPIWNLMAYAHSGEAQVAPNVSARAAANAALYDSTPDSMS